MPVVDTFDTLRFYKISSVWTSHWSYRQHVNRDSPSQYMNIYFLNLYCCFYVFQLSVISFSLEKNSRFVVVLRWTAHHKYTINPVVIDW